MRLLPSRRLRVHGSLAHGSRARAHCEGARATENKSPPGPGFAQSSGRGAGSGTEPAHRSQQSAARSPSVACAGLCLLMDASVMAMGHGQSLTHTYLDARASIPISRPARRCPHPLLPDSTLLTLTDSDSALRPPCPPLVTRASLAPAPTRRLRLTVRCPPHTRPQAPGKPHCPAPARLSATSRRQ